MDDPKYMETPKAAERLNFAPGTLAKLRCTGGGPPFLRLSARKVIYATAALDEWAQSRQFTSTSAYSAAD